MKLLSKDRTLLLSEACSKKEMYFYESEDTDADLEDELFDVEELEDDLPYVEEMVSMIECKRDYGNLYMVEYSDLLKLMEYREYDEVNAVEALAEHNCIDKSSICIVIESEQSILEKMEEIGAKGGSMLKDDIKANATKNLKDLKDKGLNLVKKKNKKKNKKKK